MVKTRVKMDTKGLQDLSREISEHPERFGVEVECPNCGETVRLLGKTTECPSCGTAIVVSS